MVLSSAIQKSKSTSFITFSCNFVPLSYHFKAIWTKSHQNIGAFLNNIPTPIVAIDTDFKVTYMNHAGIEATGKTKDSAIGEKCFNLFKTTHCNTPECRCMQAMNKDGIFTGECGKVS